jgi:hypothetical protein
MISLVWPSNVTMMWSGIRGMLFELGDVGDDGSEIECIVCESGDVEREEEAIVLLV